VSKRDEVRQDWRRLHNEKLCDLYSAPNTLDNCVILQNRLKYYTGRWFK